MANTVKGRNPKDLQEINESAGLYAVVRGVRGYNKERENRELKRANDILRKASAFFAQAELDRRSK